MSTTIYALSSGQPPAAIAIIRISGPSAGQALANLCGKLPRSRRATYARLRDPVSAETLDHGLILWFPGPATATGEDLAELHLHGGRAVVARVMECLSQIPGLILAEPGAFTRRAFENGRMDLAEAEGLADLLFAETEGQRLSALRMAEGGLSTQIQIWQNKLLEISARVEALLDFADEDDVAHSADAQEALSKMAEQLQSEMQLFLARPSGERLRDGVRVALAGPPNAGKSTLVNALAGREAAIVSPRAGTTRDIIEVPLILQGRPFIFEDMAGIHDNTDDEIEAIGIERAHNHIAASDIILWLDDMADSPFPERTLYIHARSDVTGRETGRTNADCAISAVTGVGMDTLIRLLVTRADQLLPRHGELAINQRHKTLISACAAVVQDNHDLLILAENLRLARSKLDQLTGRAGTEDMLDALFGRFCIGK